VGYLTNEEGPVPLVLDVRIVHTASFGSSSDPNLNGHLHYPNDIDRSLNDVATDKIRKYRPDYHNNPPNDIFCMSAVVSTSGRLHSEFVCLLFLQVHRETDRFFADTGVELTEHYCDQFHDHRETFSSQFKTILGSLSPRLKLYVLTIILTGRLSRLNHTLTHHTSF